MDVQPDSSPAGATSTREQPRPYPQHVRSQPVLTKNQEPYNWYVHTLRAPKGQQCLIHRKEVSR